MGTSISNSLQGVPADGSSPIAQWNLWPSKIIASLSYLLDCRLVFIPIFIFSPKHIRAFSEGQEVCVLGRKYKVLDKPKPLGIQTPAHHRATVLLYEIGEIIRIDDSLFDTSCFNNPALEPTVIDPLLHLVNSYLRRMAEEAEIGALTDSVDAALVEPDSLVNKSCRRRRWNEVKSKICYRNQQDTGRPAAS